MSQLIKIFTLITFGLLNLSAWGVNLHWNFGRSYQPFKYATPDGILIENTSDTLQYDYLSLNVPAKEFVLDFRAKNINGNPSKKYNYYNKKGQLVSIGNPHWGFIINCLKETFVITVKGSEKFTALEPVSSLEITVYNLTTAKSESKVLTDKVNPYDGDNLWMVKVVDGILSLYSGNKSLNHILNTPCHSAIKGFGFFAGWGDKIKISDINVITDQEDDTEETIYPIDTLKYYLANSKDPMEGFWTLFDRELEESLIKLGGSYYLACVKEEDNYVFIYLDGAIINSEHWQPGDIKAVLSPSYFPGIYNVDWIDSMKDHFNKDVKAQESNGNTLVIQFPYQSSKIRLRKIPD